ncbi:hypothetical protein NPIL_107241, partial [Nephila pilipes]
MPGGLGMDWTIDASEGPG